MSDVALAVLLPQVASIQISAHETQHLTSALFADFARMKLEIEKTRDEDVQFRTAILEFMKTNALEVSNITSTITQDNERVMDAMKRFGQLKKLSSMKDSVQSRQSTDDLVVAAKLPGELRFEASEEFCLGGGTYGDVYKGTMILSRDQTIPVAVKVFKINVNNLKKTPKLLFDVKREIAITHLAKHPNIISCFGADLSQGLMVTELAVSNLSSIIHDEASRPENFHFDSTATKLSLVNDLFEGMRCLHFNGIVHRDVKSANVLLVWDGFRHVAKICDFGMAKSQNLTASQSNSKSVVGTQQYNAPEAMDDPNTSPASDMYSCGVIVNELFTQEEPWTGYSLAQVYLNVSTKQKRPNKFEAAPDNVVEQVLAAIVGDASSGCWSHEPSNRPTAASVVDLLLPHVIALRSVTVQACDDGRADFDLGEKFYKGVDVLQNYAEAFKHYRAAADKGHARATASMGVCYQFGHGVTQNNEEALKCFRFAAKQNDALGQFNLGVFYFCGLGVTKNDAEAFKYYKLAADQGHVYAQYNLGACYEYGTGVMKDETEAAKYYKLAADQGHVNAQYALGVCYDNGKGVTKNEAEAFKYYKLAADQGHAEAQSKLGVCYVIGKGVTSNETEAVKYYKLATDQANADAQYNLGWCFEYGRGVTKDETEAFKYYKLAADQGHGYAQTRLDAFSK